MPSRCVVIVLDGLGDRSYSTFGHRTPLQVARTPHLDGLAERGANGLFHPDTRGMAFSSQDAHFSLFGYDWRECPRRSVLEAAAAGIDVGPDDVVVLARLVSAFEENRSLIISDRRPPASLDEMSGLMADVERFESKGVTFQFIQVAKHEGILLMKGEVSPFVTDTDPLYDGRPVPEVKPFETKASDPVAQHTARALKEYLTWAYRRLNEHPINKDRVNRGLLPLNAFMTHLADQPKGVMSFKKRWGLKGLSISSKLVQWGLARILGMESHRVRNSGDPAADLAERIAIATKNLPDYDFIHVHTMAPDEAAHTKNPVTKKLVIEALDRAIGESIHPMLSSPDLLLVVTSDHSTPSSGPLIHSGEPVPMTMIGSGVRRDAVKRFSEVDCAGGVLGMVRGREFMLLVLNHLDRCKLNGIRHTPDEQVFWPGEYEPFTLD